MDNSSDEGEQGGLFMRFPLETATAARRSFARLIRAFAKGKIDRTIYHELVYGMAAYFQAMKTAKDDDFENRLEGIEKAIEEVKLANQNARASRFGS